jgi:formylglycine-generating enzyme required for sulfatase activity
MPAFLYGSVLNAQELPEGSAPALSSAISSELTVEEQQRLIEVDQQLAAARRAMQEGRVDQPDSDCAWLYYQNALNLDPENQEAHSGLEAVQKEMINRALGYARELDFESADDILAEASLVRDSQVLVEEAQNEISVFRQQRSDELKIAALAAMKSGNYNSSERVIIDLVALGVDRSLVDDLRQKLNETRVYGGYRPGQIVRDPFLSEVFLAPELVVIPTGSFMMGSPPGEEGREENEGPQHRVHFRRGFAIGQSEVSVAEFRAFVERTGYRSDAQKSGGSLIYHHHSARLNRKEGVDWRSNYDGHEASEQEPVVHVSWNDAQAYVDWLSEQTGKSYRLPSEAEFEYVMRGGRSGKYWWGRGSPEQVVENLTGEEDVSRLRRNWASYFDDYGDGFWGPAPVGSFGVSPFGLHDIAGNVGEWVEDCWHENYMRAPLDGSSWVNPGCKLRVIRGGYWASSPTQTRSAFRLSSQPSRSDARIGFRVARDL